jgi:hypothetical protein
MEQGVISAIRYLSNAQHGGILTNGQTITALNYIMSSNDKIASDIAKQITESISKICNGVLNESHQEQPARKIENQETKLMNAIRDRASDLCW